MNRPLYPGIRGMFRHCDRRGERIGPADGTRSQSKTGVRNPVHAVVISVRYIAAVEEEQRAGENGGVVNFESPLR